MAVKPKKRMAKQKAPKIGGGEFGVDLAFSLVNVRLVASKANLAITGSVLPTKMTMTAAAEGAAPEMNDRGEILVFYRVKGEMDCRAEENSGSNSRIEVFCQFEVQFTASRMPTKPEVEFAAGMAANIAWPYIRMHVTTITAQMSVPPITMPLLRATPDGKIDLFKLPSP